MSLASTPFAPAPHMLTLEEFVCLAVATPLVNHGRRWCVSYGLTFSAFSDAATADAALADVHEAMVNNALYLNLPEAPSFVAGRPDLPPAAVLAQYPAIVARFSQLGL